ncbi:MAG: hypothetical protein QGI10_00735 [Vicinamibacterales bacterium]|nr:hypothetical protein [Vicinamibacterales bacterium]HJN42856.1 hypothetical protein [Vicinamibacterales bacterium]
MVELLITCSEWLAQAFDDRHGYLGWVRSIRLWDPLRSDPRFQALLRRMNLPGTAAAD